MTDIKSLNDNFRKSFNGGKVLLTTGINAKRQEEIAKILNQVRCFNNFTKANDPYKITMTRITVIYLKIQAIQK